jgi:hypothetical protein
MVYCLFWIVGMWVWDRYGLTPRLKQGIGMRIWKCKHDGFLSFFVFVAHFGTFERGLVLVFTIVMSLG